jgi:hypothetical protein
VVFISTPRQDIVTKTSTNDLMLNIHLLLEILGPPNSAVIPLPTDEVGYKKTTGSKEMYWPRGNNGITWISNPNQNYR